MRFIFPDSHWSLVKNSSTANITSSSELFSPSMSFSACLCK